MKSAVILAVGLSVAGLSLVATGHSATAEQAYRILVTNDDGIESPGVQELALALESVGEVTLVAPCGERSGSSMSIALGSPVEVRPFGSDRARDWYCAEATPAGAAYVAVKGGFAGASGFDLVVSGINAGANVGEFAHMSGTVGAAMMGAYLGIPAIASSLGDRSQGFGYAAAVTARLAEKMKEASPEPGVVYSINFPKGTEAETQGVVVAPMGGSYFKIEYAESAGEGGSRIFEPRFEGPDPYPAASDSEAYGRDYITITPLKFDWTAYETFEAIESWGLSKSP